MPAIDLLPNVVLAGLLLYGAVLARRWWRHRQGYRAFAAAHQLRFRGMVDSQKHHPYMLFEAIRQTGLAHLAMEGAWRGWDIAVCQHMRRRNTAITCAIVSLHVDNSAVLVPPGVLPGPRAAAVAGSARDVVVETHFRYLLLRSMRSLRPEELTAFVDLATDLAGALDEDARAAAAARPH